MESNFQVGAPISRQGKKDLFHSLNRFHRFFSVLFLFQMLLVNFLYASLVKQVTLYSSDRLAVLFPLVLTNYLFLAPMHFFLIKATSSLLTSSQAFSSIFRNVAFWLGLFQLSISTRISPLKSFNVSSSFIWSSPFLFSILMHQKNTKFSSIFCVPNNICCS